MWKRQFSSRITEPLAGLAQAAYLVPNAVLLEKHCLAQLLLQALRNRRQRVLLHNGA